MKNSDQPKMDNLKWTFDKKKCLLMNNDETILELIEDKPTKALFNYNGNDYRIRNEGFWNPVTIIESDGNTILILKRHFLGSKAKVEFNTGKIVTCKVRNSPLVNLSFLSDDGTEILNYRLQSSLNPNAVEPVMTVTPKALVVEELVMLIVLGFYSFRGIATENSDADFIIMTAGA